MHQNLAIVDHYIDLCEKSVREEPDNDVAREYLYQAYQQKADLLAVMTEHGDPDPMNTQPMTKRITRIDSAAGLRRRSTAGFARTANARFGWKAVVLAVPGLLLCSVALADHIEKHFKVDAHPVITLHNPNGAVTVKAWTKSEVMVIATRANDQVEVDATQTGNRVDIMTHPVSEIAAPPDSLRADFEIRVPEDAELQIHDDSGRSASIACWAT